jgi:hypothetical protein
MDPLIYAAVVFFLTAFSPTTYAETVVAEQCEKNFALCLRTKVCESAEKRKYMVRCLADGIPPNYVGAPPAAVQGRKNSSGPHPNQTDALQCVQKFFGGRVEMGPAVFSCNDFARLESARIVDTKNNGNNVDVIAEITLRAIQEIGGGSMAASMCTGTNWANNVPANGRMTLTKVLTFQVFSTQAVCLTNSLQPLVSATADR